MKFHNRAFPYPILDGSDYSRDDYIDGGYQASFEHSAIDTEGNVLFTVEHFCTVDELRNLVSDGKQSTEFWLRVLIRHFDNFSCLRMLSKK